MHAVDFHSQFLLPFGSFVPEKQLPDDVGAYGAFHDQDTLTRRHPLNAIRRHVLREVDLNLPKVSSAGPTPWP